jgi:hypothetical protein
LLGAEFIANTSVVTLCVNASDSYFGLSQKIMMSFHAVMKLRALSHVTHMLKIDDTDVLEGTWSGFDAMALQQQLQTTLAAVDYAGRRLTLPPADGGNGLGYRTCMLHPTLLDQPDALSQYWRQRYVQDWPFRSFYSNAPGGATYADGGSGYFLSRHAMELATSVWQVEEMEDLAHFNAYEDGAVADALRHRCVAPQLFSAPGVAPADCTKKPGEEKLKLFCSPSHTASRDGRVHLESASSKDNSTCASLMSFPLPSESPLIDLSKSCVCAPGWCGIDFEECPTPATAMRKARRHGWQVLQPAAVPVLQPALSDKQNLHLASGVARANELNQRWWDTHPSSDWDEVAQEDQSPLRTVNAANAGMGMPSAAATPSATGDLSADAVVYAKRSGSFTIAQIADVHLTEESDGTGMARNAIFLSQVRAALDMTEGVDLAVLSGDQIDGECLNTTQLRKWGQLTAELDRRNLPHTAILGNHDGTKFNESWCSHVKGPIGPTEEIVPGAVVPRVDILRADAAQLLSKTAVRPTAPGTASSWFVLDVLPPKDEGVGALLSIVHLDSGGGGTPIGFREPQIRWFRDMLAARRAKYAPAEPPPVLVFSHYPFAQLEELRRTAPPGDCWGDSYTSAPSDMIIPRSDEIMSIIWQHPEVVGVFTAHEHCTTVCPPPL